MTDRDLENMQKIIDNNIAYWKANWPYRYPKNKWQRFLQFFWDFRWARKLYGGRFVKGQITWLAVNEKFDKDLMKHVSAEEIWN